MLKNKKKYLRAQRLVSATKFKIKTLRYKIKLNFDNSYISQFLLSNQMDLVFASIESYIS